LAAYIGYGIALACGAVVGSDPGGAPTGPDAWYHGLPPSAAY